MLRYGRSMSFEVIEIGTGRKPICEFLIVFHFDYVSIFYRFGHKTIYWPHVRFCHFRLQLE